MQDLPDSGVSYRAIMPRVVDTAVRLVTTNDDLIGSVEGIECIMIEAMYHNYAGNLRRAWMAVRRATTVAEMMGLHRGLESPSLRILESETRAAFDPDQVCFRLVEMDGYLSMMLGLPKTSLEARFATPRALEGCQPIDRMQRIHCAVGGRILQRNDNKLPDLRNTDTMLQKAAAEMPPQWWLIPNLSAGTSGASEILHQTFQLMIQFAHFHLLIRLHLPNMLRSVPDGRCDYGKFTAVNASRETLARFLAFHTSNPGHYYCRGIEYLAFIATVVLCIAHIDTSGQHQVINASTPENLFDYLTHSRPSDRGMMERTLNTIDSMAGVGTDAIASKIARVLRHLLEIEAKAAEGTSYTAESSINNDGEFEYHGESTDDGKGLRVHIPHFGIINFGRLVREPVSGPNQLVDTRQQVLRAPEHLLEIQNSSQPQFSSNTAFDSHSGVFNEDQLSILEGGQGVEYDWDLGGVDFALLDGLFRSTAVPSMAEEETLSWGQWLNNG